MKYVGSKNRHARELLPLILKDRKEGQWYVEPFCGGCNILDKVSGLRIGADKNKYLIALLLQMQKDYFRLPFIGESFYLEIKRSVELHNRLYPDWLVGYVGFQLSFGAKWFGGYRRDKLGFRDYEDEAQRNIEAQRSSIKDVAFYCCDYWDLDIPANSIVYCDPPYANTVKYSTGDFDHVKFWAWCDRLVENGHTVFVSEYTAPDGWKCVWSKEVHNTLDLNTGSKVGVEKLFTKEK